MALDRHRFAGREAILGAHPVEPRVHESSLAAPDATLTKFDQRPQTVGATLISIMADAPSAEAMNGLLTRAISLKAQRGGAPVRPRRSMRSSPGATALEC